MFKGVKFPHSFDDQLEDFLKDNRELEEKLFQNPEGYFVRSDKVSLKCGKHGIGPYHNLREIIESIVTTRPGHRCFEKEDQECELYLMKYIKEFRDPETMEFRIFVFQNQIRAISQQNLYQINEYLVSLKEDDLRKMVQKILDYFESEIKSKMSFIGSYVMDFALLGSEGKPYFIEVNSFGKEYASGSALFGWIQDDDILTGKDDQIVFRYTNDDKKTT